MRATLRSAFTPTSQGRPIPAPVGGWNARDPVAAMPSKDAIFLDNFFPRPGDVSLRPGSALFATLPADVPALDPHDVRALLSYSAPDGTLALFAAADDGIYDITNGGTVVAADSVATNAEWQSVNISTAGGSFLWCCNGVDDSRYYNGTAWTVLNTLSTPALTGIASADITNVSLFKTRLVFCKKDSLSFWYLPVNSVAGAAVEFPLGSLFKKGGYLVATATWALDGGNGPDDYFVAVTSEGEVAVYQGTDPSSVATWSLKGIYYVGKPLGRRCFVTVGGEVCLLTVLGTYPLSKVLVSAAVDKRVAISDKISLAWTTYTAAYSALYGWQILSFPEASLLLVNVPILSRHDLDAVYSYQFAMNTMTGAWCRFAGMSAEVWGTHNGELYFALNNVVYKAWTGTDDVGRPIEGRAKTAFMYPSKGRTSHVKAVRPIVQVSSSVNLQLGIDQDFNTNALAGGSAISYAQALSLWDTALWDQGIWSAGTLTTAEWRTVFNKPGHAISLRLRIKSKGVTMSWIATDTLIQRGGLM